MLYVPSSLQHTMAPRRHGFFAAAEPPLPPLCFHRDEKRGQRDWRNPRWFLVRRRCLRLTIGRSTPRFVRQTGYSTTAVLGSVTGGTPHVLLGARKVNLTNRRSQHAFRMTREYYRCSQTCRGRQGTSRSPASRPRSRPCATVRASASCPRHQRNGRHTRPVKVAVRRWRGHAHFSLPHAFGHRSPPRNPRRAIESPRPAAPRERRAARRRWWARKLSISLGPTRSALE